MPSVVNNEWRRRSRGGEGERGSEIARSGAERSEERDRERERERGINTDDDRE